jgi:hypothetical protein
MPASNSAKNVSVETTSPTAVHQLLSQTAHLDVQATVLRNAVLEVV